MERLAGVSVWARGRQRNAQPQAADDHEVGDRFMQRLSHFPFRILLTAPYKVVRARYGCVG